MRSMTFLVNDRSTGGTIPAVAVTLTENADGTISFSLNVLGPYTGDLRGFFFDLADESRIGTLSVVPTSAGFTEFRQGNDSIKDLGSGANMQGLLGSDGGYDAGIEIGTAGSEKDDYRSFSFTLSSSSGPLSLDDFANVDFGLRLTSVGWVGGERDEAVKMLEHTSAAIDARDDAAGPLSEDSAASAVGGNVFANDANLNRVHFVAAVNGSSDNVGEDIQGAYGTLHLNRDGSYTYTLDSTRPAVQALNGGQQVSETFSYTAKAFDELTSFSSDSATLTIDIIGSNDAPVIVAGDRSGRVFEDGPRGASGQLRAVDVDHGHSFDWSVDNPATLTNPAYRFLIDNFRVTRNDQFYFNDDFGNNVAPPSGPGIPGELAPSSPVPPNNPPTYTLNGSFQETGGRAILDGSRSVEVDGTGTPNPRFATSARLRSDNSTDLTRGLKIDDSFTVEGQFDLVLALDEGDRYGIRLTDSGDGVTGSDIVQLAVRRGADGKFEVALAELDGPNDTSITLQAVALEPLAGENQIVLRLSHNPANPGVVQASFDLLGGAAPRSFGFTEVGHIFGTGTPGDASDDEVFTRAEFRAVADGVMQNGVYGTLSVNANGAWSYELNNAAANVQALAQDEHVTDTFTVRVTDEHGATDTETVTIDVTGTNDVPIITGGTSNGFVAEDTPTQTASGQLFAFDQDHNAQLRWSAGPATVLPGPAPNTLQIFGYTADFQFKLDRFTIERNDVTIFDDTFSDGIAPPSAPNFSNGTPANYIGTFGYLEADGLLHLDGARSFAQRGVGIPTLNAAQLPVLATNVDPNDLTRGLKSDDSFSVEGTFNLVLPDPGQAYGIALTDNTAGSLPPDQLGDDTLTLLVRRAASGGLLVQFNQADIVADTSTILSERVFDAQGASQITLRLVHDVSHVGTVRAEFDVLGETFTLANTGHIFGTDTPGYTSDDENWTRAQIVAFGPDEFGESTAYHGTYGSLTVQQDGTWTYALDNDSAAVQALPGPLPGPQPTPLAQDVISVRVVDEYGTSSFRPVFISVAGTNDAPQIAGTSVGQVYEDGAARTASAQLAHGDVDQGAVVNWSLTGSAAFGDASIDATGRWTYNLNNGAVQHLAQSETLFDSFTVRAIDQHGAFDEQTVTVSIGGTGDRPTLPPVPVTLSASEDGAPAFAFTSAFDLDARDLLHWSLNRGSSLGYFSDYEFRADSFTVTRDAVQIFHDAFDAGGAPPSAPNFANNTTANYSTSGIFREIGGKLVMRGSDSFAFRGTGNDALVVGNEAILVTNTDPTNTTNGLKKNHDFVVDGVFDLLEPQLASQAYGLTLTDAVNQVADDLLGLTVRRNPGDGQVYVQFVNSSAIVDTSALVERDLLVTGGADQIRLILSHEANSGEVSASYQLLTAGIVTGGGDLGQAGIFGTDTPGFAGDDENWIRAGLFSNAIDLGEFDQTLNGAFGTLTVSNPFQHNFAQLAYTAGAGAQALAQGESAIDSFFVRAVDPVGMSSPQRVDVTVNGANDAPVVTGGVTTGLVYEDGGARVARGQLSAVDVDHNAVLTWGINNPASFGFVSIDGATGQWTYSLNNAAVQNLAQGASITDTFVVSVTDQHFASSAPQTVSVTVAGTNDRPNLPPVPLALSASEDGGAAGTMTTAFDIDNGSLLQWSLNRGSAFGYFSPYEFRAESFRIVKNNTDLFFDDFNAGGPPPQAPDFIPPPPPGGSALANYSVNGGLVETGGKLVFSGSQAIGFRGTGINSLIAGNEAILNTNIDPANTVAGLKKNHQFVVDAVYDLIDPALVRQQYGIQLTDGFGQIADDLATLFVRKEADGLTYVRLADNNSVLDTADVIGRVQLLAGGADQIRLMLSHAANADTVTGSYELLTGGVVTGGGTLGEVGIFGTDTTFPGDDNNWIRAGLIVNALDTNESVQTLTGTYGTLNVGTPGANSIAQLTYTPDDASPAVQALAQGQSVVDTFFVRVADQFGMTSAQRVDVTVTGTNDPVAITSGVQQGDVVEDAEQTPATDDSLIVSGTITFTDIDLRDGHTATFAPAPGNMTALGTFVLAPVAEEFNAANGSVAWTYTLDNGAAQFLDEGATATEVYLVTVTDDFGATATQAVTVSVHGTADDSPNQPPVAVADNNDHDGVIEAGVDFLGLPFAGDPKAEGNVLLGGPFGGTDTDADGDTLTVSAVNGLAAQVGTAITLVYGSLQINQDGGWTYTLDNADPDTNALRQAMPVPNEPVLENVTYTVTDGLATDTATLSIRILGTNDAPIVATDTNNVAESALDQPVSVSGNVLTNDLDPEGSPLQVFGPPPGQASNGTYGTLAINSDGSYTYTTNPALVNFLRAGEVAHDIFTGRYAVSDGQVSVSSGTRLDIAIHGADEAPSAALGAVFEDGPRKASGEIDLTGATSFTVTGSPPVGATPWADYRFRIDNLTIVRNGTQFVNDDFGNGTPPPAGPGFSYLTSGTFTETNGRANMDGSFAVASGPGFAGHSAILDTGTADAAGLRREQDFRIEARFDLVLPDQPSESYGIRLTDAGVPGGGDDIVEIAVRQLANGTVAVVLREGNVPGEPPLILADIPLASGPNDNRVVLRLEHTANTDEVRGSFDLIDGSVVSQTHSFSTSVGHIFGNESWTRAQFLSFSPAQTQNGAYGTLSVDADGDWTYGLRNSSTVQALAQDERVTDVFTVQVNDALGSRVETVAIDVFGSNDFPFGSVGFSGPPAPGTTGAYVIEDGRQQVARGFVFGSDVDHGFPVQWSVTANTVPGPVTPYSANYRFTVDELSIVRDGVPFMIDTFDGGGAPPTGSSPDFSYLTTGVFSETGGRAVLDGRFAGAISGAGTPELTAAHVAILDTNLGDASPGRGLKSHHDFTIEARFDLNPAALPAVGQAFGMSLSDRSLGELPFEQQGDDIVGLLVTRNSAGDLVVIFEERDAVADTVTIIDSEALAAPAPGSQIVLRLGHDTADFGRVSASFEVLSGGVSTQAWASSDDPLRADRIFGAETPANLNDDEGWTRVQIWGFGPDSNGASTTAQGAYGSLTIEPGGDWSYTLDNQDPDVQALGRGQIVNDSFNFRSTDAYGASTSRAINVNVIGTGDEEPPVPVNVQGGPAAETFVGSKANDYFAGGGGADLLIGLEGSDIFDFNNINEGVDSISGFTPGVGGDILDLRDIVDFVPPNPPSPVGPINYVRLGTFQTADGINTQVLVNPDGIGEDFVQIANLIGTGQVFLDQLINDGNLWLS